MTAGRPRQVTAMGRAALAGKWASALGELEYVPVSPHETRAALLDLTGAGVALITAPEFDRTNNVEHVSWERPAAGEVQIIVRAFRIPVAAQSYALAVRTL